MANEIAVGYISIVPETSKIAPEIKKAIGDAAPGAEDAGKKSGGIFGGGFLESAGAVFAGNALTKIASSAGASMMDGFSKAMDGQAFESSMAGLLGSAEQAADAVERVGKVSRDSSLDASAYRDFAQGLAYIGVEGEQSEEVMRNVGKAITGAGGDSSQFDSVTTALTAMSNEGKVTNDRLNQMSNAGLPILDALSTKLGVDIPEVQKMATDGLLEVGDVIDVLEHGTGEWMEKLTAAGDEVDKGLGASFSRLKDNVVESVAGVLVPAMDAVAPAVSWAADAVGGLFSSLRDGSGAVAWIGPVFGGIRDVIVDHVVPAVQGFWSGTVKPVFEQIRELVDRVWSGTLQPLFESWWETITDHVAPAVMGLWEDVVQPAFQQIGELVSEVWESWLHPALSRFVDVMENVVAPVVMWLWQNVVGPAFTGIGEAIKIAWNVISPLLSALQGAIKVTGTVTEWLWQNIVKPAFSGISSAIEVAWGIISPLFESFQTAMDAAGTVATWLYENAIQPAWDGIQTATETVTGAVTGAWQGFVDFFSGAVETIKRVAEGIFGPLQSAADTVFGAVARLWNSTLGKINFEIPSWVPGIGGNKFGFPKIEGYALGGAVRGPGTATSDDILALLSNGEHVLTAREVSAMGGHAAVERMRMRAVDGTLPAFAKGGAVGREPYGVPAGSQIPYGASGFPEWVYELANRFGLQASTYPGHQEGTGQNLGIDWSGPVDDMHEFAVHLAGIPEQLEQLIWMHPSTGEQIGVADGQHVGPGTDQPGYYRNDWSGHQDHVHTRQSYAIDIDPVPAVEPDAAPIVSDDPVEVVAEVDDSQVSTGTTTSGGEKVTIQGIAGQIAKDAAEESVGDLLSIFGLESLSLPDLSVVEPDESGSDAEPGASAAAVAEPVAEVSVDGEDLVIEAEPDPGPKSVQDIVRGIFAASGWGDGAQWSAADNIITRESSWDPLAQNPSSTAFGLFQFLDDTWATVGATKTEDPEEQAIAGAAYMGQRYGDPAGAWDFWQKNNWYDSGGIASGIGLMQKNTLEPERVLSPAQTAAFEQLIPMLTDAGVAAIGGAVTAIAPEAAPIAAAVAPAVGGAIKGGLGSLTEALSEGSGGGYGEVTINIDGAQDPEAVAAAVQRVLRDPRRAGAGHTTL